MSEKEDKKQQAIDGEILSKEIKSVAPELTPESAKRIVSVTKMVLRESWSGPLPPPAVFKQYPREVQKAIVQQATAQMKHRHKIESQVVASNIKNSGKGMTLAFWLTTAMLTAGTLLVALGQSTAGLIAVFGVGGFQGGNYLYQKWREMQNASKRAKKQDNDHIEGKDEQETLQTTN